METFHLVDNEMKIYGSMLNMNYNVVILLKQYDLEKIRKNLPDVFNTMYELSSPIENLKMSYDEITEYTLYKHKAYIKATETNGVYCSRYIEGQFWTILAKLAPIMKYIFSWDFNSASPHIFIQSIAKSIDSQQDQYIQECVKLIY